MSKVFWLEGLSGSGKTTLGKLLYKEIKLVEAVVLLDGDLLRSGINYGLGFGIIDRHENIRRTAHIAKICLDNDISVVAACITPCEIDRKMVFDIVGQDLIEIYVKCSLEVCEKRDVKGLYKKARSGEIELFTGISSPFEEPEYADVIVETDKMLPEKCIDHIIDLLTNK